MMHRRMSRGMKVEARGMKREIGIVDGLRNSETDQCRLVAGRRGRNQEGVETLSLFFAPVFLYSNQRERVEKGKDEGGLRGSQKGSEWIRCAYVLYVRKWDEFVAWSLFQNLVIKLHIIQYTII